MSLEPMIKERALLLKKCRAFFEERGLYEVDCPALSPFAPIDLNIDVIPAEIAPSQIAYLHTSPEYAMKRLLSAGSGDIFFLGHVYRQGEKGPRHSPEFTMAEWYRIGLSFDEMIQETADFVSLFLGPLPLRKIGYREAFEIYLNIDYANAPLSTLLEKALPYNPSSDAKSWSRDTLIHFLLTHAIEPFLGQDELTALIDYPPDEAALAHVIEKNGELVAERFEIYHRGVELANGYHELPDAVELRKRFTKANRERESVGKEAYRLDEEFLACLKTLPDCCGVSVGFDRAFMLRSKADSLIHYWRESLNVVG